MEQRTTLFAVLLLCVLAVHVPAAAASDNENNSNTSKLSEECLCGGIGVPCLSCGNGTHREVFSPQLRCVECFNSSYGWLLWLATQFVPTTVFVFVVLLLRIKLCADSMNAVVFICQVLSTAYFAFPSVACLFEWKWKRDVVVALFSVYNIFNLQFFQNLLPPLCISEDMSETGALALNYVAAVYPLFLILVIHSCVKLYDRNFKPLVLAWKVFGRCFSFFVREFDIKCTLVDTFTSFFLLSFFKFFTTSLFIFIKKRDEEWNHKLSHKIDPFYSTLSSLSLAVFCVIPTFVMLLYPTKAFQKCLNCCGMSCLPLHIFMDAFQGCYKNGTEGTRDYRYLAGLYMFLRCLLVTPVAIVTPFVASILIALCQPYKRSVFNTVDSLLLAATGFLASTAYSHYSAKKTFHPFEETVALILLSVPLLYMVVLIGYCWMPKCWRALVSKCLKALQWFKGCLQSILEGRHIVENEENLRLILRP